MRRTMLVIGALALFALAFAFGYAGQANAQTIDEVAFGAVVEQGAAVDQLGDQVDRRRVPPRRMPPWLRRALVCHRIAVEVHKACPCEGPDGEGWKDHEEYVQCVKDKLEQIAENRDKVPERCMEAIGQRAEKSKIGTPGFECPKPRRLVEPPKHRQPPERPEPPRRPEPTEAP